MAAKVFVKPSGVELLVNENAWAHVRTLGWMAKDEVSADPAVGEPVPVAVVEPVEPVHLVEPGAPELSDETKPRRGRPPKPKE